MLAPPRWPGRQRWSLEASAGVVIGVRIVAKIVATGATIDGIAGAEPPGTSQQQRQPRSGLATSGLLQPEVAPARITLRAGA